MTSKKGVEVAKVVYVKMMAAEKEHYKQIAVKYGIRCLGTFFKTAAAFYTGWIEAKK